ncbi:MAG: FAD-binding oxidoreductase [Armatimonadota bacterium]
MEKADVFIAGAGVIGWSIAAHLLRLAPRLSVVVADKASVSGSGATGRAAGGVRAQFGTPINIAFSLFSIREFERVMEEVAFRQHGYLFVTSKEEGMRAMDALTPMQQSLGVPVRRLTPAEVHDLVPILNTADVVGATFSATDGYLDPHLVCSLFEKEARTAGARFLPSTEVLAFDGHIVSTSAGDIACRTAVLATGHWSARLATRLGLDIAVRPGRHQLALTGDAKGLPKHLPMVVDMDTTFHFRPEGRGLLVGYTDHLPQPVVTLDQPPPFDARFFEELADAALHRLPMLAEVGFDTRRSWAGWYAETPDRHAIVGKTGHWIVAAGFGGHGIMHSPAAGQAVAELVLRGECKSFDLHALRPSRFAEGELTVELVVI